MPRCTTKDAKLAYYRAHIDEARQLLAGRRAGGDPTSESPLDILALLARRDGVYSATTAVSDIVRVFETCALIPAEVTTVVGTWSQVRARHIKLALERDSGGTITTVPVVRREPTRVIFLDFDGVLLTLRAHLAFHGRGGKYQDVDPVCASVLARVLRRGTARLVIVAGARSDEPEARRVLRGGVTWHEDDLARYLHPDWRVGPERPRSVAIDTWLIAHPEVDDYLILDDDAVQDAPIIGVSRLTAQRAAWVRCHCHEGLNSAGILRLYDWADCHPANEPS